MQYQLHGSHSVEWQVSYKWWTWKNTTETSQASNACSTVAVMTNSHSECSTCQRTGFVVVHATFFLAACPPQGVNYLNGFPHHRAPLLGACCLITGFEREPMPFPGFFHIVSEWNPNRLQNVSSWSLTTVTLKQKQTFLNLVFPATKCSTAYTQCTSVNMVMYLVV